MATQVENGKGFEWAMAEAAAKRLQIRLDPSDELRYASNCFEGLSDQKRKHFRVCAEKAIAYVADQESLAPGPTGSVGLSSDSAGVKGDVRDVLIQIGDRHVGISCKTNHEAFKHSRLSGTIDFVKKWGLGDACSTEYWNAVLPIFSKLRAIKDDSGATATWASLGNYQERYYMPVLRAWRTELLRVAGGDDAASKLAAENLCRYVIGRVDFWKVIATSDEVRLYSFNLNRSLSTNVTSLPDRVLGIDDYDGSVYSMTVRMNHGYQFNFRLHNAKKEVEPSLKFDVQAEGLPTQQIHQGNIRI